MAPGAHRRSPIVLGALAAATVLFALVGCTDNTGDRVAVVGDSITALDQVPLQERLGAEYELAISGGFGKTIGEALPDATTLAASSPDQVIVNLGTNDALRDLPTADSMVAMEIMVDLFDSAQCIHLVNVNEHMVDPLTGRSAAAAAERLNAGLEELAASDARISVIDWSSVAAGALNDESPPFSTLTLDSIHPTAGGNEAINELYADALEDCGGLLDL